MTACDLSLSSRRFPIGTETESLERPDGHFEMWALPSGIIVTRLEGHGRSDFAAAFVGACERFILRGRPITVFHDWESVRDYDLGVRTSQIQFVTRHRRLFRGLHILVASRILSMGVTTASIMLSLTGFHLAAYRERRPFDRELEKCLSPPPKI